MSESLPSTATGANEKEKASITSAHDTRQMGSDFSATIDFNKQNNPDVKPESPASPERPPVDEVSITTENPEVVAAALERERIGATQKLEAFDAGVAKTGKPLENSEFLDRAGLLERSASLSMLSSQKKLALAETSPEAATPVGQAEIARLKEERKKAIEGLKAQFDAQLEETKKRAATELMAEDTNLSIVSAKRLIEGIKRQEQVRADLEAAGMTPEEVKAVVAEAVVESPEEKQGAAQGENIELAIAQLQVEGPEKNAPTEKPDDNLRVALLNFAEAVAAIAARSASPEEKSLFEAVLENIKKLSELGAAKVEKDAKISIREMLGVAAVSGGGQEVTSSALDRFTKGMEEDKKGKGGSFFKNLLGKIGQLSWVKKLKGLFGSAKSGLEGIPGITKLGLVGVKGRIEGLLAGQFGKLDLGKKLGAKKVGGAEGAPKRLDQVADENAKVFTAEENAEFRARIAAGEGAKAENAPEDLEGVRAKMQELNAKMDAYDIANPGKSDSPESKAMEAEYAPLRARFDELNKTTQAAESPIRPTPKEVIDALEKQSGDETISLNEAETAELLARVNKMKEVAAAEEAAKAGVTSPEAVRPPAVAVEGQPEAVGVSADDLPEEITAELDPSTLKLAVQFNSETYAALKGLSKEAVTRLIDQSWEGINSKKAELVKNRILYRTLVKEVQLPDDMRVFLLETLKKRGYADYEKKDEKYTFSRSKV